MKENSALEDRAQPFRLVGKAVNVLNNLIKRDIECCNPNENVTGMQGVLLYFIYSRKSDVYSKDIEDGFCMRRATASGYLALLEQNGMIVREDVRGDKRLKKIRLTEKAERLLVEIEKNIMRNESKLAEGLTQEEISEFLRIAAVMTRNLNR